MADPTSDVDPYFDMGWGLFDYEEFQPRRREQKEWLTPRSRRVKVRHWLTPIAPKAPQGGQ